MSSLKQEANRVSVMSRVRQFLGFGYLWAFGVVTCMFYALLTARMCFDTSYLWSICPPLLLIAPINALILLANPSKTYSRGTCAVLGTLNGLVIVIALFLLIAVSPLCVLACLGLISSIVSVFISLFHHTNASYFFDNPRALVEIDAACLFYLSVAISPVLTALLMRFRLRKMAGRPAKAPWLPMSTCFAAVLSFMVIGTFSAALTRYCASEVENGNMVKEGLLLMRAAGDEGELLRACYGSTQPLPWFFQPAVWNDEDYWFGSKSDQPARITYYRVKGRPFNSVARPRWISADFFFRWDPIFGSGMRSEDDYDDDYSWRDWDHDFAGDVVGGVVRGLSLNSSDLSGWIDAREAVAKVTWNMAFHCPQRGRELRAQILLPPQAVVTSCSLWVGGVERHAVIATRQSSKRAYTETASSGESPLLISTAGAGRVLLQSSTGWWGKDARLKLEYTTPLVLPALNKALMPMPMITERNFSVDTKHRYNFQEISNVATQAQGELTNDQLCAGKAIGPVSRDAAELRFVAPDPAAPSQDVVQEIRAVNMSPSSPLIVVVDGSSTMAKSMGTICDALRGADARNASIIWAADSPAVVASNLDTHSPEWTSAVEKLRDSASLGGQNNAESLSLAINKLSPANAGEIVWLHGPQPVRFSGFELPPLLARAHGKIHLYEYQVVPGPNEVIKSLNQTNSLVQVPRTGDEASDMKALLQRLSGQAPTVEIDREPATHGSVSAPNKAAHALELSQLETSDLVFSHLENKGDQVVFGTLAEQHNIVTPLTSALVLEHEDYAKHNVETQSGSTPTPTPAAAGTQSSMQFSKVPLGAMPSLNAMAAIPAKPEPPISALLFCAALLGGLVYLVNSKRRKNPA